MVDGNKLPWLWIFVSIVGLKSRYWIDFLVEFGFWIDLVGVEKWKVRCIIKWIYVGLG